MVRLFAIFYQNESILTSTITKIFGLQKKTRAGTRVRSSSAPEKKNRCDAHYFLNDLYPLIMALTMVCGDMMSSRIAA